jgi:hypothetical protein
MASLTNSNYNFKWSDIGDIELGRPNLGNTTNVAVYRLMQYSLRSVLNLQLGGEIAQKVFFDAGKLAGEEFCKNLLDCTLPFNLFVSQLQKVLIELKIGTLRAEKTDLENLEFIFVITEDIDCSGLPITDETVCDYDEGFLSGILKVYTGIEFQVHEVDCWSKGDRVCRFAIKQQK